MQKYRTVHGVLNTVIAIPTLNEADHIGSVISSLSEPGYDGKVPQIWIIDGLSADGTAEIVRGLGLPHVTVIDNPARTQAHAINLAALHAQNVGDVDVLIRADAHAHYPEGFVARIIATMIETGAESIVVPLETIGGSRLQDAAAILFRTWLGTGGSPHRTGSMRGFVEHGHHAAFLLDDFIALGGYDTDFLANEDAEFDYRLTQSGRRIFLENNIAIQYIPRLSLMATFRQYKRNGTYRIRRAVKHNIGLGLRQAIPALLLPILLLGALLGISVSPVFWIIPLGYFSAILAAALQIARKANHVRLTILIAALAAASHLGFSVGASLEFLRCRFSSARRRLLLNDKARLMAVPDRNES
ncbi:hypothetical protein P775_02695 [Puniceibacterium antarcticum]|uniref:Glycosyltransferase 2-like domain-containing protein n=1 Tax=Puniceibacterium antarcticum TaxID=1206336 RepID=A0A2G8RJM1_9RHOB|nr:glycosyltransferase [Puniceibacterium antarcticum]PIL21765.1 hypothetical protein P775_02695 [Puniceibacterium antarcticum]